MQMVVQERYKNQPDTGPPALLYFGIRLKSTKFAEANNPGMKKIMPLLCAVLLYACTSSKQADLLVYNAKIYTVDSSFRVVEAMVITNGKIEATGSRAALEKEYSAKEKLDAQGKFIYPGFIDAHAHFAGYSQYLSVANLTGTKSWNEILDTLRSFARTHPDGWLTGRGWDQNDWEVKAFPDKEALDTLFPDRPVYLTRIDGHAAIANQRALDLAGIKEAVAVTGGEIEEQEGSLTGILIDNATDLVSSIIPEMDLIQFNKAVLAAQANCFAVGLTTVDDCGLDAATIKKLRSMQDTGSLKMRIYAMLSDAPSNFKFAEETGIIKTDRLHVCSFKVYGDGALGSRGACLLAPYNDQPGHTGFLLSSVAHFDSVASWISQHAGWQMCTHAIGDSGNRTILNIYGKYLEPANDRRWRIEHAQVVSPVDFALFGKHRIIPSVQPTHATSDMYWAGDRLGAERLKSAYAYHQLMEQNGWLPLGTDFPVEDISPFKTFYAAVVRKDAKGWPAAGFQVENALDRQSALRGMTIWAARSNFEEQEKGSLEKGKWADFIIVDQDLMTTAPELLLQTKVLKTFVGGERVYEKQ